MTDETGERPLGSTQRVLREHPALFVSGVYVLASAIGMFYSWDFLRRFDINVFYYAEIGDFLLASLKELYAWALVFAAILLVSLDNAMSRRVEAKVTTRWFRWYGTRRYRSLNYLVALVLVVVFLDAYAISKARQIRAGEGEVVTVMLTDESPQKEQVLLGTTGRFVFLYDHNAQLVYIHPHENVLMMRKYLLDRVD
ncbi:MAG: hypothetical protein ACE5OQ_11325 [Woeseia sp.]